MKQTKMEEEMLDVVDENDNVVDTVTKKEMRQKDLLHRGAAIFVFNSKGEIFVHKRTAMKDIYPSMYDMTCGGGVQAGEDYDEAAKREIEEEVGIKNLELKFLFKIRYKSDLDNFMARVYSCIYDGEIKIQEEEIEKGSFMTIEKLKELMEKEEFCPDALEIFKRYKIKK